MSAARLALERVERGLPAELDIIPPWQWAVYFAELSPICPSALPVVAGAEFTRQRNALRGGASAQHRASLFSSLA